jgi:ELP3 family radical SAM enzyme/protein acetyltransferase
MGLIICFKKSTQMDIEDIVPVKKYQYTDEIVLLFVKDLINTCGKIGFKCRQKDIEDNVKLISRKYRIHPAKTQMRNVYEKNFIHIPINLELKRYFVKRVMRSESGVIVVTIVTKPGEDIKFSCPEKCAYCPTETNLNGLPTQPKSYISTEPAMLRATRHNFDIGEQVRDRIKSYYYTGNLKNDNKKKKIEVILSGGTWDVMPKSYRDQVILEVYHAFNTITGYRPMLTLSEEKTINETSLFGVIGLTIETRPDYVDNNSLIEYLDYGVTRVQLGGQSTHDDVLKKIKRGCSTKHIKIAIRKLKGIGMKVVTHWMPDLPGSTPQRDKEMFHTLITSSELQSDDWKVYPCAVVKSASSDLIIKSEINEWYENGSYVQYAETNINDLIDMCIEFKTNINPWIRIERLVRDIPSQSIEAGYSKIINLRQVIQDKMHKMGKYCKCIRCMEIKDNGHLIDKGKLVVRKYLASEGIEYHISYEVEKEFWTWSYIIYCVLWLWNKLFGKTIYYEGNREKYCGLFGFLRLRIDPSPGLGIVDELKGCGLIREVHVYGSSISVGNTNEKSSQHKGVGQMLIKTAEEIIKSYGLSKSAVIAGIGAREYYRNKCGYSLEKYYMIKTI